MVSTRTKNMQNIPIKLPNKKGLLELLDKCEDQSFQSDNSCAHTFDDIKRSRVAGQV